MKKYENNTNTKANEEHSDEEWREYYHAYCNHVQHDHKSYKISLAEFKRIFKDAYTEKDSTYDPKAIKYRVGEIHGSHKKESRREDGSDSEDRALDDEAELKKRGQKLKRDLLKSEIRKKCKNCFFVLKGIIRKPRCSGCRFNPKTKKCKLDEYLKTDPVLQKKVQKLEKKLEKESKKREYERYEFGTELLFQWIDNIWSENSPPEHPLEDNSKKLFVSVIPAIGGERKEPVFVFNYPKKDIFVSNPGKKDIETFGYYKGKFLDDYALRTLLKPEPYPWYSIEVDLSLFSLTVGTIQEFYRRNLRPIRKLLMETTSLYCKEKRGQKSAWGFEKSKKVVELKKQRKTYKQIIDVGIPGIESKDDVRNALKRMRYI